MESIPIKNFDELYITCDTLSKAIYGEITCCLDKTDAYVAIKCANIKNVLSRTHISRPGIKIGEDLLTEISILKKLRGSPNVVQLIDVFKDNISLYIVMPKYNIDLCDHLFDMGSFGEELSRHYFKQMVDAIEHLHSLHIIHRDISLENFCVDDMNNVVLIDFGLAKQLPPDNPMVKGVSGKSFYISYESLLNASPYDGYRSDIWSLGITIGLMITGKAFFSTSSSNDVSFDYIQKHGFTNDITNGIPNDCVDLIKNILVINPYKRLSIQDIKNHKWVVNKKPWYSRSTNWIFN